jgi:hypothetical protein
MPTTFTYTWPVYIDWLDQQNQHHVTTGQQLDSAIHELLLSQSPWTDEWRTTVPYMKGEAYGIAKLVRVTADHERHQAILTVQYRQPDLSQESRAQVADVVAIFLKTVLNRFCQRTVFGVRQERLAVRLVGFRE